MKSSIKFFTRHKLYTMVNFIGLTIALTFVLILVTYIKKQLSTDSFHEKGERIVLITNDTYSSAYYLQNYLKERFPEIEAGTAVRKKEQMKFSAASNIVHADVNLVDSSFFDIFSFKVSNGAPERFKHSIYNIVISRSFGRRLFNENEEDIIGKSMTYQGCDFTICGIMDDIDNSVIPECDIIMRGEWMESHDQHMTDAGNSATFILTKENTDIFSKKDEILNYFKEIWWIYQCGQYNQVHLIPLRDIYFYGHGEIMHLNTGNRSITLVLIAVCAVLLLFSILNYTVLTISITGLRAKEIGTRRLLGSSKAGIAARFISEAIFVFLTATIISTLIAESLSPAISSFLEYRISVFKDLLSTNSVILIAVSVFLIGSLAGLAPTAMILNINILNITTGAFRHNTKRLYSKVLIIIQNSITTCMLIAAITIMSQVYHLVNMDMGYKTDNILYVTNHFGRICDMEKVKNELLTDPSIKRIGYAQGTPFNLSSYSYENWIGGEMTPFYLIYGDDEYFNILGFKKAIDRNISGTLCINESGLKEIVTINERLGLPSTQTFFPPTDKNSERIPIGTVYRDFKILSHPGAIAGMKTVRFGNNAYPWDILIETDGDLNKTYDIIRNTFQKHFPDYPFEASYIKTIIRNFYRSEIKTLTIVSAFAIVSLLLSILGMLAINTYFMMQRQKDAAIKKIFGAHQSSIIKDDIISFIRDICIAMLIGTPAGWYIMTDWLNGFTDRIPLHWWIFVLSAIIILISALLTTLWQSIRISNTNPTETLNKNL